MIRQTAIAAALVVLAPGVAHSEGWYENQALQIDGFCSLASDCWTAAEASVLGDCKPLGAGPRLISGHAHYDLTPADVARFERGEVLREVALDRPAAESLLAALRGATDDVLFPFWEGSLDLREVGLAIDGMRDSAVAHGETVPALRHAIAAGGKVSLVGEVVHDEEGRPWFWKRLVYSGSIDGQARVYYLGGGGAAVNVIEVAGDSVPPAAVGGVKRTDTR
jgi:hypothetical protein